MKTASNINEKTLGGLKHFENALKKRGAKRIVSPGWRV